MKLYPSTATRPERDRLEWLASELDQNERDMQKLRERRQELRDEQRRLNAKVYRS